MKLPKTTAADSSSFLEFSSLTLTSFQRLLQNMMPRPAEA